MTLDSVQDSDIKRPRRDLETRERPSPRVSKIDRATTGWRLAVLRAAFLVVVLAGWQLASGRWVRPVLVSRPTDVADTLWTWMRDGSLLKHVWATLQAAVLGFIVGTGAGVLLGYALAVLRGPSRVVSPFMTALYTLPRLALAPLFIMWFGLGLQFKVMFSATIVFFLVYFTTRQGVEEVPRDMIQAVKVMGGTRRDVARRVVLPSALIWVLTGVKISLPYALVGVVVGEMLVGDSGLGFLLSQSANRFNPGGLFATIVVLLAIAMILDQTLSRLSDRSLRWKTAGSSSAGAIRE